MLSEGCLSTLCSEGAQSSQLPASGAAIMNSRKNLTNHNIKLQFLQLVRTTELIPGLRGGAAAPEQSGSPLIMFPCLRRDPTHPWEGWRVISRLGTGLQTLPSALQLLLHQHDPRVSVEDSS